MSETTKVKIFGLEVSPEDITLGADGSVVIRNPNFSELVKRAQLKIVKELMEDPSRALGVNVGCGNIKC
ncbi:hypothetical protein ASG65_17740 [Bacillus sp. Leaf13]|nr:hypothetical protein ASG65_17740 [Bacillus sp. Leaf13]